jgi:hypothetical protein
MELNFYEKFSHYYNNNKAKSLHGKDSNQALHVNCIYTRKKICQCKFYNNWSNKTMENENDFSNFLIGLINGDSEIKIEEKIKFNHNKKSGEFTYDENEILMGKIKGMNYFKAREYLKNVDSVNLSISDFKEIEKSINDDKKICEKCGTNLYGDNFHKGWKNESGEFVLLCFSCSKKYFSGASELKFDIKKEDMIPVNMNKPQQMSGSNINNPNSSYTNVSFKLETSAPTITNLSKYYNLI